MRDALIRADFAFRPEKIEMYDAGVCIMHLDHDGRMGRKVPFRVMSAMGKEMDGHPDPGRFEPRNDGDGLGRVGASGRWRLDITDARILHEGSVGGEGGIVKIFFEIFWGELSREGRGSAFASEPHP